MVASQVGFTDLVRIKSILIGTGGGQLPSSPRRVKVWVNRPDGVAFDEVEDLKAEQEFVLLEGSGTRGAVEYPVRISRFGSVTSVDLFFVSQTFASVLQTEWLRPASAASPDRARAPDRPSGKTARQSVRPRS